MHSTIIRTCFDQRCNLIDVLQSKDYPSRAPSAFDSKISMTWFDFVCTPGARFGGTCPHGDVAVPRPPRPRGQARRQSMAGGVVTRAGGGARRHGPAEMQRWYATLNVSYVTYSNLPDGYCTILDNFIQYVLKISDDILFCIFHYYTILYIIAVWPCSSRKSLECEHIVLQCSFQVNFGLLRGQKC